MPRIFRSRRTPFLSRMYREIRSRWSGNEEKSASIARYFVRFVLRITPSMSRTVTCSGREVIRSRKMSALGRTSPLALSRFRPFPVVPARAQKPAETALSSRRSAMTLRVRYRITSSARTRSDCGTVRPSACAVLRRPRHSQSQIVTDFNGAASGEWHTQTVSPMSASGRTATVEQSSHSRSDSMVADRP